MSCDPVQSYDIWLMLLRVKSVLSQDIGLAEGNIITKFSKILSIVVAKWSILHVFYMLNLVSVWVQFSAGAQFLGAKTDITGTRQIHLNRLRYRWNCQQLELGAYGTVELKLYHTEEKVKHTVLGNHVRKRYLAMSGKSVLRHSRSTTTPHLFFP